jgi:metal-sulfur cluster biosynthetic enzyme
MRAPDRDAVLTALRTVPEPCAIAMGSSVDITAMGLVDDIAIDGPVVRIELVLTDPSCVHFRSMQRYITDAVAQVDGVERVEVALSTTTLWTPDRVAR